MAAIQGDLSILSLGQLLQALVLGRSSGLLSVASGLECRALRVSPAGIRLVRGSRRCHRFERQLRGAGGEDTPAPFPNPETAARLMGEWMIAEICELLTWTRGTFQFHPFVDPAQEFEEGPFDAYAADCDVAPVALRAARWIDEYPLIKAAIPDLRHVPVRTAAFAPPRTSTIDGEAMDDILRLIDGRRPVIHLLEQSVFPRFIVLRVLYQLTRDGVIRLEVPTRVALSAAA